MAGVSIGGPFYVPCFWTAASPKCDGGEWVKLTEGSNTKSKVYVAKPERDALVSWLADTFGTFGPSSALWSDTKLLVAAKSYRDQVAYRQARLAGWNLSGASPTYGSDERLGALRAELLGLLADRGYVVPAAAASGLSVAAASHSPHRSDAPTSASTTFPTSSADFAATGPLPTSPDSSARPTLASAGRPHRLSDLIATAMQNRPPTTVGEPSAEPSPSAPIPTVAAPPLPSPAVTPSLSPTPNNEVFHMALFDDFSLSGSDVASIAQTGLGVAQLIAGNGGHANPAGGGGPLPAPTVSPTGLAYGSPSLGLSIPMTASQVAVVPQGHQEHTAFLRSPSAVVGMAREVQVTNPTNGKTETYERKGRPLLYASDIAACRRVARIARKVGPAVGLRVCRAGGR